MSTGRGRTALSPTRRRRSHSPRSCDDGDCKAKVMVGEEEAGGQATPEATEVEEGGGLLGRMMHCNNGERERPARVRLHLELPAGRQVTQLCSVR